MCGRIVDPDLRSLGLDTSWLKINPFADWKRRYNVKPTQDVLILDSDGRPVLARWWLIPSWHKGDVTDWKASTFNARIEDAANKPSFRGAWKYGRCLMPVGGYYEWTGSKGKKQPHFIQPAGNEETLWFAGLLSIWREAPTCAIVTRAANEAVDALHHRMPVILNSDERDAWLAGSNNLAIGAGATLRHYPVNRFGVNDDGEDLLEPLD